MSFFAKLAEHLGEKKGALRVPPPPLLRILGPLACCDRRNFWWHPSRNRSTLAVLRCSCSVWLDEQTLGSKGDLNGDRCS